MMGPRRPQEWWWCRNHDVCIKHPSEQHAQSPISKCQWISNKGNFEKAKATRIVALGSLLRSLEVDFFSIQEPHFVTVEDRQAGARCLSKYGYGVDGPLHEEGRGGVALAWRTSKWTSQTMQFLSPRALKASLSSGPLEITLMVVHFHHKHSWRQAQWKEIAKELHGRGVRRGRDQGKRGTKRNPWGGRRGRETPLGGRRGRHTPLEGEEKEAQRERGPQSERFETNWRCGRVVGAS